MERTLYTWTWFLWLLITISLVFVMLSIPDLVAARNYAVLSEAEKLPRKQVREDLYLSECGSALCIEVGYSRRQISPDQLVDFLKKYDEHDRLMLLVVLHIDRTMPMRYVKEMKLLLRQENCLKIAYAN